MKKGYLLIYAILLFVLVGCDKEIDENVFVKGNEYYSGTTKEQLEMNVENNRPSKLIVKSDSHYASISILKSEDEDKNVVNEFIQIRDYIKKEDYKGHPRYDIIERSVSGDKTYKVISVNNGDYYHLISLNLISDAAIDIEKEKSLDSAAEYYDLQVKNTDDGLSTDYYYEVLRKIEADE